MNQQTEEIAIVANPTPSDLLSQAIEKGLDVEQLSKLMDLQERWQANEARKAFAKAMTEFQKKKPKLVKSSKVLYDNRGGGQTDYNFTPLPEIQKKIDPILSKLGLSYSWKQERIETEKGEKEIKVTCVVTHIDGHSEETWLSAPLDDSGGKNKIQSIGSAVSYLDRYSLKNAFGLSTEEDDDGTGSELTPHEIQELQLIQIEGLFHDTKEHLSDVEKKRAEEIIRTHEVISYTKMIKHLKRIKDEHSKK